MHKFFTEFGHVLGYIIQTNKILFLNYIIQIIPRTYTTSLPTRFGRFFGMINKFWGQEYVLHVSMGCTYGLRNSLLFFYFVSYFSLWCSYDVIVTLLSIYIILKTTLRYLWGEYNGQHEPSCHFVRLL